MKKETVLRLSRLAVSGSVVLMGVSIALLLFVDALLFVLGVTVFVMVCDLFARAYVRISEMESAVSGVNPGSGTMKKDAINLK